MPKRDSLNEQLRRESRHLNTEFRRISKQQADEAERLNRGLEMLAGEDKDEIETDDD